MTMIIKSTKIISNEDNQSVSFLCQRKKRPIVQSMNAPIEIIAIAIRAPR